jgi:hypothetical protein
MESATFEKTLQAYQRQRPFRQYALRFVSGDEIKVDHPEAVVVRAGVGVYISPEGAPTLFDHESVSEVIGLPRIQR